MKRFAVHAAIVLAGLGLVGLLVMVSGIIPLKASSGHWPVTRWVLEFSKRRSISTHSLGIDVPPLDAPALVVQGAAAYESGCRPCHGSPGADEWEPVETMLPEPPALSVRVPRWEPRELFYIVKHGIKFTGMPAWPDSVRDDEIWPVVALLLELPGLTGEEYRRLAFGEAADSARLSAAEPDVPGRAAAHCVRCHGSDGLGRDGIFPVLAGQSGEYIEGSLRAYAGGVRHSGMMQPVAAELDGADIRELAAFYATRTRSGRAGSAGDVSRGAALAHEGVPARKVPACRFCHGPTTWPRNAAFPRLEGLTADYIALQLRLFREGRRGGSPYAPIMHAIARTLTDAEIDAVARYYASAGR